MPSYAESIKPGLEVDVKRCQSRRVSKEPESGVAVIREYCSCENYTTNQRDPCL